MRIVSRSSLAWTYFARAGYVSALTLALMVSLASAQTAPTANLSGVKTYLLTQLSAQASATKNLKAAAANYYKLAREVNFDYKKLALKGEAVRKVLRDARTAWIQASPAYERIEGIVAGVEQLSQFDIDLDAGTAKSAGGDAVVSFDLKLPDGRRLEKPGNLFGINEGALWNTVKTFSSGVRFDLDGDGQQGFGDALPDANVLQAAGGALDAMTGELIKAAKAWQPTFEDVFGALSANVPTVSSVFLNDWRNSRFVLGDRSSRQDFVALSRLGDLSGNVASWRAMYAGLASTVAAKNSSLNRQILDGLSSLAAWVAQLEMRERAQRFGPEQAELIVQEGENRATAIVGRIVQAQALLGIKTN